MSAERARERWQMMASPKMEPFHAITKGMTEGGREGESALHRANAVIDYGNIFSVEAKVKQHTSRSSLSRGHSNCDLWRRRKRCS